MKREISWTAPDGTEWLKNEDGNWGGAEVPDGWHLTYDGPKNRDL